MKNGMGRRILILLLCVLLCAGDLARLASVMLTGGYGEHRFFSRNVIDLFTAPQGCRFRPVGPGLVAAGGRSAGVVFRHPGRARYRWPSGLDGHPGDGGPRPQPGGGLSDQQDQFSRHERQNPNGFSGSCYTASTLGFVPQLLPMGLDGEADVSAQLLDLLADMAMESLKLIPGDAAADHPYVKNAQSKIAVLRAWAAARDNADALALADAIEASLPL